METMLHLTALEALGAIFMALIILFLIGYATGVIEVSRGD